MTPTHIKSKSLAGRIFTTVLAFTVVVVVVLGLVYTTIFYLSDEQRAENNLIRRADNAAAVLNGETGAEADVEVLGNQFDSMVRYTLIAPDGSVLFDSVHDAETMENHADRPEVEGAVDQGEAAATRYSETLRIDTVYAAVELDDGSVIRLSEERRSLFAFIGDMIVPVVVALVVAIATVFALSRLLTRRHHEAHRRARPVRSARQRHLRGDGPASRAHRRAAAPAASAEQGARRSRKHAPRFLEQREPRDENAAPGDLGLRRAHEERHDRARGPPALRRAHLRRGAVPCARSSTTCSRCRCSTNRRSATTRPR